MIPTPFISRIFDPFSDDNQRRLALPFGKPFIKSSPFNRPILMPMPSIEDIPAFKKVMEK